MLHGAIAIIDDERDFALTSQYQLEDLGIEPVVIDGQFRSVDELFDEVRRSGASGILCDNRLSKHGYAAFTGAEAVADFNRRKLPAVLMTQFLGIDADTTVRRYRRHIPAVLMKSSLGQAELLEVAFDRCVSEIAGCVTEDREPYRTLVVVQEIGDEANLRMLDVTVPAWRPREAVRLPADMLPPGLEGDVVAGTMLFAQVNLGAGSPEDLYFTEFEPAPPPADV